MSQNPRDSQFTQFASLVLSEMLEASKKYSGLIDSESGDWQEAMQRILARRAYDLVSHTVSSQNPIAYQLMDDDEIVATIPDMDGLP